MAELKILVSFQNSDKILCLPSSEDISEVIPDAIRKLFNIPQNTDILLQILNLDWNEYIDFDKSSRIVNKGKIRVVHVAK